MPGVTGGNYVWILGADMKWECTDCGVINDTDAENNQRQFAKKVCVMCGCPRDSAASFYKTQWTDLDQYPGDIKEKIDPSSHFFNQMD